MKIQLSKIQKILLSDLNNLDPVGVILEDIRPGHGRITITYSDFAWTKFWGAMGSVTVGEFFCSTDNDYLVRALSRSSNDEDLARLDRIITTVKTGIDSWKAMEIAANPIPNTAPLATARSSSIEADEI